MPVDVVVSVLVAVVAGWVLLVAGLVAARPKGVTLTEALRLLPDVLRLLRGLVTDRTLPRSLRLWLWLALAWVLNPFDLVPEFLPVVGLIDEVVVVAVVLRSVIRRAGVEAVRRHWVGGPDGLAVVLRLCGLPTPPRSSVPFPRDHRR